jgi:hypothetical protein
MKLDPGMHIGLHLVFFGKTGVTSPHLAFCCVGARHGRTIEEGTRGLHDLLMAIEKFFKWIKARPICRVRSEEVVEFFTDIIYRFGIPNAIITDNRSNFTGKKFLCFHDDNNIRIDWAAVSHLRTNG